MRRRSVVAISVLTTLATEFCLKHWASFRWTPAMTHWLKISGVVAAVLAVVGCGLLWRILSSFMVAKGSFSKLLTPVAPREVASLYQEITGSSSPAEETVAVRPQYLQAAEKRAVRMGISPEQLLGEYSRRLKESNRFPPMVSDPKARQEWIAKNCREK